MLRFAVRGRTLADLKKMSKPQSVAGGTSEGIVWAFHDTEEYVTTVTTELIFFKNTKASDQLSNLSPAGMLPADNYFEIYGFMVDMLIPEVATSIADYWFLLFGSGTVGEGAPTFEFKHQNKNYGPWALSLLHGTGGITGYGNAAAATEYANNSIPDGGFYQDGAIVLAPTTSFEAKIRWGAAQTLTASKDIRVTMAGVLHRDVL